MRVHCLQHADVVGPGPVAAFVEQGGHSFACSRLYADEPLPASDDFEMLIVLGGPMNIYEHERHPWLVPEKALIGQAVADGRRVLGLCLGAQLIADVLGGPVTRSAEYEIGWHEIEINDAGRRSRFFEGFAPRITPFLWHGDTFAIPPGAVNLMSSAACENQAFAYGETVAGVQFHPETTPDYVQGWIDHGMPPSAPYVQSPDQIFARPERFADNTRLLEQLLANFLR